MAENNGEIEFKTPMGGVRLAGRDLLLAGTLIALGAGAVGVQYLLMTSWRDQIARGVDRSLSRIEERFVTASNEREEILQQLRLRNCAEALGLGKEPTHGR